MIMKRKCALHILIFCVMRCRMLSSTRGQELPKRLVRDAKSGPLQSHAKLNILGLTCSHSFFTLRPIFFKRRRSAGVGNTVNDCSSLYFANGGLGGRGIFFLRNFIELILCPAQRAQHYMQRFCTISILLANTPSNPWFSGKNGQQVH